MFDACVFFSYIMSDNRIQTKVINEYTAIKYNNFRLYIFGNKYTRYNL